MADKEHSESNVISLLGRRASAAPDCFAAVETYWQALCDGRLMPRRSEVDPRGIAGHLDRTCLLERVSQGEARIRVAGSHLAEVMGRDMRGMPVSVMMLAAARADLSDALEAVFEEPARVELLLDGGRAPGGGRITGRMLLLPLRDEWGEPTRALACIEGTGPFRSEQRFSIAGQTRQTLIGYGRRPDEAPAPRAIAPRPAPRPGPGDGAEAGQRPRLRLVQDEGCDA